MSGHNKWSSIKHRKAAQDSKRGAAFNKIIREIVVAAREGGADLTTNYTLSAAVDRAKAANMPKDTMEKAIKRGAGAGSGENYERLTYEVRGPAGTALIITTLTDNKNRTVADVRHIFSKYHGTMAENGSVSWMFERKGLLIIRGEGLTEDDMLEACAEAGAEDFRFDGEVVEVYCDPADFAAVREWFKTNGNYEVADTDLAMVPKEQIDVTDEKGARRLLKLIDALEENDDVQKVYSNWSMTDEMIEAAVGG